MIEEKINDLIARMIDLGYEYASDTCCVLFANIEDGSDLSLEDWDAVEDYINTHTKED